MAPEKDNPQSQAAVSAVAQAMAQGGQRAIARFVPRAKGAVQIGLLSPCLRPHDSSPQPDCLWLNILPFTEDVRTATFASFQDQEKRLPSDEQLGAMRAVLHAMRLTTGSATYCPATSLPSLQSVSRPRQAQGHLLQCACSRVGMGTTGGSAWLGCSAESDAKQQSRPLPAPEPGGSTQCRL